MKRSLIFFNTTLALVLSLTSFAQIQNTFEKSFGDYNEDLGNSVEQLADDGYIIAGFSTKAGTSFSDACLIRTDKNGDTLWVAAYGGTNDDLVRSVDQTSDGGFIVAGETVSFA